MNKLKSGADLSEYQHIKKILVADDDADMRSVLVELLESLNFTILEAFDGREAVEVLKKNRVDHLNTVDLLITDFKKPK
jgi:two-component system OmpR family response regulator